MMQELGPSSPSMMSLQDVKNLASQLQCSPLHSFLFLSICLSAFQPSPLPGATWLGLTGEAWALSLHSPGKLHGATSRCRHQACRPVRNNYFKLEIIILETRSEQGPVVGLAVGTSPSDDSVAVHRSSSRSRTLIHPNFLNPAEMSNWATQERKGYSKGSQCELTGLRGSRSISMAPPTT